METRHASEGSNEWLFLQERLQELAHDLREVERQIAEAQDTGRSADLPEARRTLLTREQEIVDELLDETARARLEQAIGSRLRRLQTARFTTLAGRRDRYGQRFWDQETEIAILNDLLQRWQAWNREPSEISD